MASNEVVTAAEVERFKLEKAAERTFFADVDKAINDLAARVSPKNPVLRSMRRFQAAYK